jgi:predicted transposase/invertase (TIGR01784 family)
LPPRQNKPYDRLFKDLADEDPRGFLHLLGIVPLTDAGVEVETAPREVSPPVLQIDHLYRVRTANREWLVHFEFQTHYRPDMPGRMVRYAASLYLSHGLPVDCVLVLLAERFAPPHVPSSHAVEADSLSMTLDYRVVRLWEIDGAQALALNNPGFLVLMPLLRTSEKQLTQAVERIAREPDRDERAAELIMAAGLRYDKDDRVRLLEASMRGIFTEEILKDSSYYQELVEIGEKKGLEKGEQQAARRLIRELIASRFPNEDATPDLDRIHNLERLNEIFQIALKAQSAAEVKTAIKAG